MLSLAACASTTEQGNQADKAGAKGQASVARADSDTAPSGDEADEAADETDEDADAESAEGEAGASTSARKRRTSRLRDALLGDRANYRFTIHAPVAFESDIRDSTLLGRWQYRTDYDPVQFEGLVSKLREEVLGIVQAEGYFSPTIEVEASDEGDRVTVKVDPGKRTRVSSVDIKIEGQANDNRALNNIRQQFGIAKGDPFISSDWQSGKTALINAMHRQGYLRARVTRSNARINAQTGEAALSVVIDSGDRIAFGDLRIQGLERYPEKIINDLRTFKPGDPYSERALLEFQTRLNSAGYFNSVSALPDLLALQDDPDLRSVPIQVVVEETERHRLIYGIGYATDDGVRGQVGFQDRNLYGLQMESALVMSTKRQRAFANFRTPYDADNRYYGFGGRVEREKENNVTSLNSNVYVGYGQYERDIDAFTSVQYQIERDHFHATNVRDEVKALVLGKAWTLNRFDNNLNPSKGYGLRFEISGASRRVLSDATFTRFYASTIGFKPMSTAPTSFWRAGTLIGRVEFGAVNAASPRDIPSANLFRAGGTNSLRGYGYRTLGFSVDNMVLGQRYLAIGSLEYRHRVTETVYLDVFYDYGNVADSWRSFNPVSGYGMGVGLKTPVGPVKLDLAYGQAIHRYRLHFSIGFSF